MKREMLYPGLKWWCPLWEKHRRRWWLVAWWCRRKLARPAVAFAMFLLPALSWAQKPTVIISGDGAATVVSVGTQGPAGANIPAGGSEGQGVCKSGSALGWCGTFVCTGGACTFTTPILSVAADNCAAPPFSFSGDATSGICSSAAGTIKIRTGAADRLTINSTAVTSTVPVSLSNASSASSFTVQHFGQLFSGTYDPILYFGYNLAPGTVNTKIVAGEPIWKVALEGNWNNGAGANFAEFNLDYTSLDGLVNRRPIYITVNRGTNAVLFTFAADTWGVQNTAGTNQNLLVGEHNSVVTSIDGSTATIGGVVGLMLSGTISTTYPQGINLYAKLDPAEGQSAQQISARYTPWGTGSKNLSAITGIEMNGSGWQKTTSGTITTAYAGYFTQPTIAANNYALYTSGNSRFLAGAAGIVPLTLKGAAAQTANLQEWENSGGTAVASVTAAGAFKVGANTGVSGTVVVKGSDGNNCNLVFEGGILTSETCP